MAKNKIRAKLDSLSVTQPPISYEAQTLTTSQKSQARENIAAISYETQSLSSTQKEQTRNNIGAGNSETIIVNDVVIAASSWVSDSTYADYPYKADIAITGCTENHYPQVTMGMTEATSGNYAPICNSSAGIVSIWAKTAPTSAITVSTIVCTKIK